MDLRFPLDNNTFKTMKVFSTYLRPVDTVYVDYYDCSGSYFYLTEYASYRTFHESSDNFFYNGNFAVLIKKESFLRKKLIMNMNIESEQRLDISIRHVVGGCRILLMEKV